MGSVSQPIIAATDQLGVYAPLLRGLFYLTLFTQFTGSPRRLSLDKTPIHRLAASDRHCEFGDEIGCHSPGDRLFAMGGWSPPNPLWIRFRPHPGNWWTLDVFCLIYMGRFAPFTPAWGFVSSAMIAAAAAGPSVSWRQPYAFASDQPTSNSSGRSFRPGGWLSHPHKRPRLPVENSSDDERKSSAVLLPYEGEGDKENCRPAPLALLLDYIMSKFPVASKPLARPSNRMPDNN